MQYQYDNKVLNLEEGNKIKAVSPGECKVKISIDDNFYDDSTTTINVKVKQKKRLIPV